MTITNFDNQAEPLSLKLLSQQVEALLPSMDLTELLLEINAHTGFADEFTHVSESNARAEDLGVSICAVLLAEACNIGLEPLIKHQVPALTRYRLSWVKQNYQRAETLVKANAKLVDYQSALSLAGKWGGGEVASADGMRFVTPSAPSMPDRTGNTLAPAEVLPGTTLSRTSSPDFMALSSLAHYVIPSLCWRGCWSSKPA